MYSLYEVWYQFKRIHELTNGQPIVAILKHLHIMFYKDRL